MCVVFSNHVGLVALPKPLLPLVPVISPPFSERLTHFPVSADELMTPAFRIVAMKLVSKTERNLFELVLRRFVKQMALSEDD